MLSMEGSTGIGVEVKISWIICDISFPVIFMFIANHLDNP